MRAHPVIKESHIFDFDDTLAQSDAKTYLYRNGKFVRSLTPAEYHRYKKRPEDTFDVSDFQNPEIILNSRTFTMWPLLSELDKRDDVDIYILTARHEAAREPIFQFVRKKGIKNLPKEHIFAIGDGEGNIDIPSEKRKVLETITRQYPKNNFYDDNDETIDFVEDIPNLKAYLVE